MADDLKLLAGQSVQPDTKQTLAATALRYDLQVDFTLHWRAYELIFLVKFKITRITDTITIFEPGL
jgi:hypothetical protein